MRTLAAGLAACLAICPSAASAQQPTTEARFLAAAKARDLDAMRPLLAAPVEFIDGRRMTTDDFIAHISGCEPLNAAGGMMGWACPAGSGGKTQCWSVVGRLRTEGAKVRLQGLGDPGFPCHARSTGGSGAPH